VKDPKLSDVLRMLDGKVYELKVVPVKGAEPGPVGQMSIADQVRAAIAEHEGKFTTANITTKTGISSANVRGVIGSMTKAGVVRKLARGSYINKGQKA
jgi:hypothetical protein